MGEGIHLVHGNWEDVRINDKWSCFWSIYWIKTNVYLGFLKIS